MLFISENGEAVASENPSASAIPDAAAPKSPAVRCKNHHRPELASQMRTRKKNMAPYWAWESYSKMWMGQD